MAERIMMKGNEAFAEGAIKAGCRFFFGYPITPQNEIPEYMSRRMPEVGGTFIQAESEVSAINMVYGAGGAGARAMTSSSSPGISLKQEGISYIATAEVPCVIVNVARGGPGLGGLTPSQADYFQAVKGGGHGDYHMIVFAPGSVQEIIDLMYEAFVTADKYRNPVMVLADGLLGQMMEPVVLRDWEDLQIPEKPWASTGMVAGKPQSVINSLGLAPEELENMNIRLQNKYRTIEENEVRYEEDGVEDAELIIVAYGTSARVSKSAINKARAEGKKVGLFRPITLWPFPSKRLAELAEAGKRFMTVEMSAGQMIEDVKLAVNGKSEVEFYGRYNGAIPSVTEVYQAIMKSFEGREVHK
ncbi:MAG TPA: 3-methyl-2-oxobutanoate dehydrogenase subunit VorB [Bacillota bacterium]|nr:3-methyl-2-oxobutanoate dehydrogenase subunit VorB [Bacillota bacterium]HPT87664.1 3-methyl-2-oxobutanoate dehydrogenase subunit VorB [Bacillota bacterium]